MALNDQIDMLFGLLTKNGEDAYLGEKMNQLAHALQTGTLAKRDGADACLIAAALLHDVGHFTHDFPEDCADHGIDSCHEDTAMAVLKGFPDAVREPIRLHVAAKRYLCAVEEGYEDGLSPASIQSLDLQGGPMTAEEVMAFEALPFFEDAVKLRRWDDAGKVPGLETVALEAFRPIVEQARALV